MASLAELTSLRAALEVARFSGNRRVRTGESEIEFKTDAEMKAALSELDRQIAVTAGATVPTVVRFATSKGY